jgi:transcriptional regulator with XRE-family HTH domain
LGQSVRRYRDRIGLSQAELAEAVEMSETSIGLLERGKVWPEYETLEAIADALKVPIAAFFDIKSEPVKPSPAEALDVLRQVIESDKPRFPASAEVEDLSPLLLNAKPEVLKRVKILLEESSRVKIGEKPTDLPKKIK